MARVPGWNNYAGAAVPQFASGVLSGRQWTRRGTSAAPGRGLAGEITAIASQLTPGADLLHWIAVRFSVGESEGPDPWRLTGVPPSHCRRTSCTARELAFAAEAVAAARSPVQLAACCHGTVAPAVCEALALHPEETRPFIFERH